PTTQPGKHRNVRLLDELEIKKDSRNSVKSRRPSYSRSGQNKKPKILALPITNPLTGSNSHPLLTMELVNG
ncbi:hypothetical protein CUMW_100070, partial [Citrus unshiu]